MFTTIIIPLNEGENFKVETKCTDYDNVNSFTAKITDKDGVSKTYCFAHSNNEVREIATGGYKSTGVTILVCEDEDKNVISRYEYKE